MLLGTEKVELVEEGRYGALNLGYPVQLTSLESLENLLYSVFMAPAFRAWGRE